MTYETPAKVRTRVHLIKEVIATYFADHNKTVLGTSTYYAPFTARVMHPSHVNGGKPTAYIRYANAYCKEDGAPISPSELAKAMKFAETANSLFVNMPMTLDEKRNVIKIDLSAMFSEKEVLYRPNTEEVSITTNG
jgi:hypothetical protein